LLGAETDCYHHELPVEPRVLEPEEQRDAEDDGKRTEAEKKRAPMRPREQAVEGVRKEQLRNDQRRRVVHLAPVEAPIQQHQTLLTRLQVVLPAWQHLERDRLA